MLRNNFYSTSRRHQQSNGTRTDSRARRIHRIQEVQPEFLLQSSQENFSGTVPSDPPVLVPISRLSSQENFSGAAPTGPSVSVPISQLNSDPQAHLIIRMSKKQQQKPRTVQIPPVQLTSPSRKEPFPSSVPTPVSPKTVAGKHLYRRRTECTT